MRQLGIVLTTLGLMWSLAACGDDGGSSGATATNRFNVTVAPDETALVGKVVDVDGNPYPFVDVAACSDVDCLWETSDEEGVFIHDRLDPQYPRRFEVFGEYDRFPSVVFRREFSAGELVDVGDVIIPPLSGSRVEWKPETGGTVLIAGGQLELTAGPDVLKYALGTLDFSVQAGPFSADVLPPYYNTPWVGKEEGTIGFGLAPFDLHSDQPVSARVLTGVTAPPGSTFDVFHTNPKDGILTLAGTATVDEDGVLATDPSCELKDLTFILFVPQG